MTKQLVKTALLGKWEVSDVRNGMISKHGDEVTPEQMEAITVDFLKMKLDEFKDGFKFTNKENGIRIVVEPLDSYPEDA